MTIYSRKCTPFPVWNQSIIPCLVLTVASWPAYRFLRKHVRWSGIFHLFQCVVIFQFVVIHTVKGFNIVKEEEVDIFLELLLFRYDPRNVGNLISGSAASLKPSLYIWKFSIHILLKSSLKDFEHILGRMWNEHNCPLVWTFFGIALIWDWNENWSFFFNLN